MIDSNDGARLITMTIAITWAVALMLAAPVALAGDGIAPVRKAMDSAAPTESLSLPAELAIDIGGGVKMEFVLIPAGWFLMGSEKGGDEKPVHKVTFFHPFYMGRYMVTQEQWEQVMGSNPSAYKSAKNPVENVGWEDCRQFMVKLQQKVPGRLFALPSEAQWEYACRAGGSGDYCYGDGDELLKDFAWYGGNSGGHPHPVGGKKPNAWGLYDMHGNLWEFCAEFYHTDYQGAPADGSAWSEGGITFKVMRGGGFNNIPDYLRSSRRYYLDHPLSGSGSGDKSVGVRCVMSAPGPAAR
jgi:formylglycine-generating enzyme required for sulfatase activity